jgi:hypothetical protein
MTVSGQHTHQLAPEEPRRVFIERPLSGPRRHVVEVGGELLHREGTITHFLPQPHQVRPGPCHWFNPSRAHHWFQ